MSGERIRVVNPHIVFEQAACIAELTHVIDLVDAAWWAIIVSAECEQFRHDDDTVIPVVGPLERSSVSMDALLLGLKARLRVLREAARFDE